MVSTVWQISRQMSYKAWTSSLFPRQAECVATIEQAAQIPDLDCIFCLRHREKAGAVVA